MAKRQDVFKGGRGDKLQPSDVNQEELKLGIKVELEHTEDKAIAMEIALDHLAEDPKYYTKLQKIDPHESVEKLKEIIKQKVWKRLNESNPVTEDFLTEGVEDPNILKAVFMAGGPGSGKSVVINDVMGIGPITSSTSPLGLKIINSDPLFELFLKKAGVKPSDLIKLSKKEFEKLTTGQESPRIKAKAVLQKQYEMFLSGRLGIINDGTGKNINKVKKEKKEVEKHGYDTAMVFVDTSLKTALERNQMRDRKLPDELVKDMWNATQKNKNNLKELFGSSFYVINNNKVASKTKGQSMFPELEKKVMSFLRKPIKNPTGKKWIDTQHKIKNMLNK